MFSLFPEQRRQNYSALRRVYTYITIHVCLLLLLGRCRLLITYLNDVLLRQWVQFHDGITLFNVTWVAPQQESRRACSPFIQRIRESSCWFLIVCQLNFTSKCCPDWWLSVVTVQAGVTHRNT